MDIRTTTDGSVPAASPDATGPDAASPGAGPGWWRRPHLAGLTAQRQRAALLERTGCQVVFQQRGYVVLHRTGAAG